MKSFLIFGFVLVSGVCFGQEQPKIDMQDWFKRGMNVIYQTHDTKDLKNNCYFKNNEFYVVSEYQINLPYSTLKEDEFNAKITDLSKEMTYRTAEVLTLQKGGVIEKFEEMYYTKYINFVFSVLTNDFKNIDYKYYVKVSDLYKIAPYYNKKDFFEILK